MKRFHLDQALDIFFRTAPFVAIRLLVYALVIAASILWWGGIFLLFTHWPFPGPPWLAWVVGGVLFGKGARLLRQYVLYLVKAAHLAVITRYVVSGGLPVGVNQIAYGKEVVVNHFVQISLLFAVDRVVAAVLKAFNRSIFGLIRKLPGLGALSGLVKTVLDYTVGYVDEAILSYSILHAGENPWSSARRGLVLYVQNWKPILSSGLVLALISYALVAAVSLPAVALSFLLPGGFSRLFVGIGVGLGFLIKFALMDPFSLTAVIVNYHHAVAGQSPSPRWESHLEELSGPFQGMRQKAEAWRRPLAVPPPPPVENPG